MLPLSLLGLSMTDNDNDNNNNSNNEKQQEFFLVDSGLFPGYQPHSGQPATT